MRISSARFYASSLVVTALACSGCSGKTAPIDVTPYAIAFEANDAGSVRPFMLFFDVPVTCEDARFLEKGAPPGARFKAVARTSLQEWDVGELIADRYALFDEEGLLSTRVLSKTATDTDGITAIVPWAKVDLLTAPTEAGAAARVRIQGQGSFVLGRVRPIEEDSGGSAMYFGEPETQEISVNGEIDVRLCTTVGTTKRR